MGNYTTSFFLYQHWFLKWIHVIISYQVVNFEKQIFQKKRRKLWIILQTI